MTTSTLLSASWRDIASSRSESKPAFRAPPLRQPTSLDIAHDLAGVRTRRALLTQRVGAVWIRGHVRD